MSSHEPTSHRSFHELEKKLTVAVAAGLVLFLLTLFVSSRGITWLKVILGIVTMLLSGAGCAFLVLINEHRRSRSWWILVSFGALFLCTLVSLITGFPFGK